jgi:hypothetical protein
MALGTQPKPSRLAVGPLAAPEITTRQRGVRGDDGMQIPGAVPLATSVAGPATGADPWQQPAGGDIQQAHPPRPSGQPVGHGPQQPAQQVPTADGERQPQGPACTVHHEPERRALQGATWTSWKR